MDAYVQTTTRMATGDAESPRCWVCRSDQTRPWKTSNVKEQLTAEDLQITDQRYGLTLSLVRCGECGFRFADTNEVERLTSLYTQLIDPGYLSTQGSRVLQMRELVNLARKAHPEAKTALDVGAASGLLVSEAKRQGLQATGIEPSQSLVEVAHNENGVELLCGVLPHPELESRRYDIVFLVDVIEHVADPVALLRLCADRLADNGVLLLVTPDVSSLAARTLRSRWWHYRLAHVGYFDRRSLQRAVRRVDLHVSRWLRSKWFFTVDYLASRLESYLPVAWFNRFAGRVQPLRWLYQRVVPVNLFDSYAVLLQREPARSGPTLAGHVAICRFDHWFKNVFVLPGIVVALAFEPAHAEFGLLLKTVVGLLAIGLVASSNYVINELCDAPFDRHHPVKKSRPVPSGSVHGPLAYFQWLVLAAAGIGIGLSISVPFAVVLGALWVMGCVYNLRPLRTKDLPYIDVISESVNNPLRMLAGWFIVGPAGFAPGSLLLSYWSIGCYFMATKRFAEYRHIGDRARASAYRRSFAYYNENLLLISVMFFGSTAMLLFGAFIARYRLSLVLSFPFVALVMAIYLWLGLAKDSPVQQPESLYRQPYLVAAIVACAVVMTICMFFEFPSLMIIFAPTVPTNPILP